MNEHANIYGWCSCIVSNYGLNNIALTSTSLIRFGCITILFTSFMTVKQQICSVRDQPCLVLTDTDNLIPQQPVVNCIQSKATNAVTIKLFCY
jgi:hypothetical protein